MVAIVGLWIGIGLLALAILAIIVSGVRGLINGNVDAKKIGSMILPIVIWVIILLITGNWVTAGIGTLLIMIALMIIAIVATGVRGVFN